LVKSKFSNIKKFLIFSFTALNINQFIILK